VIPPRLLERVALVVGCAIALGLWSHAQRRAGALEGELRQLRARGDSLERAARTTRTVFVRDTVTLTKAVAKWHTRIDSVMRVDTVPLTVRESVFVAAADTAIRACRSVVSSCSASLRADSLVIANQTATIRALERSRPGMVRRWGERVAWGLAGYAIGRVTR
jgi:hypothetical protein